MRALVAWRGGLFLIEGKIGVLSVSSLFLTRVRVYVGVGVCIGTHTHAALTGYSVVSLRVFMRHLEGPKNPGVTNLGIYVFVHVCKVHMCMYMPGDRMRSWTNCFFFNIFFLSQKKSKRCERKPLITSWISNWKYKIWAHRPSSKVTIPFFKVIQASIITNISFSFYNFSANDQGCWILCVLHPSRTCKCARWVVSLGAGFTQASKFDPGLLSCGHYCVLSLFLLLDVVNFGIYLAGIALQSLCPSKHTSATHRAVLWFDWLPSPDKSSTIAGSLVALWRLSARHWSLHDSV